MTSEKNSKKRIIWWNSINLLIILILSITLLKSDFGDPFHFYGLVAAIFIFSGIFIKRTFVFWWILFLTMLCIFIAKDVIISDNPDDEGKIFDLKSFINSNK